MCGRFAFATKRETLKRQFKVDNLLDDPPINYNVAPTQQIPIIRKEADTKRLISTAHWGLIPFWAKNRKMAHQTINARAETIREKPSFRHCFRRKRCIIPASGFFEWHTLGELKQPHYISLRDKSLLGLAGLWDTWENDGEIMESCTIVTTTANSFMEPIHERMPVILMDEDHLDWLDASNEDPKHLIKQFPSEKMQSWAVPSKVGNPRNNLPELIEPVA
ncbi:MAG: SOS response-associated peptidase [Opitutae bacterium]|nr:SOS response-associated peptidase [Opitutae bacterium]MBT5690233.1 SOS response-associated peptidase [Opitutae bacterium]MBT6463531.1 SOS response-associated peptidase [Opitutae bacterium]MBT7852058.1 SOS response-associated peptidase [Opitutae bacterium]